MVVVASHREHSEKMFRAAAQLTGEHARDTQTCDVFRARVREHRIVDAERRLARDEPGPRAEAHAPNARTAAWAANGVHRQSSIVS